MNEPGPPSRSPDRTRLLDINATTLRLWEWGPEVAPDDDETPLILLAHGAFDHGRMMDGLGAALSEVGWSCWAPDLRGHGDSTRIPHGSTFEPMIGDLGALAHLTDRPIGLLGHSMGGVLFLQAAGVWPDRFDWIVSLDAAGPPESAFERPPLADHCTELFDYLVRSVSRTARVFSDRQAMFEQRASMNTRVPPAWMHHLVEHGTTAVDGGWRWKYDSLFNTWIPGPFSKEWVLDDFRAIESPVLVLTGGVDELWSDMPEAELAERLSYISDVRHQVVPDAGHYPHLEQQQFVLDAVRGFMAEVGW